MSGYLARNYGSRYISILSRVWSGNSQLMKNSEATLRKTLEAKFPQAKNIVVSDISGGCGSMYEIYVESKEFKGLSTVKQHRLITETLKSEIKDMHGLRIHTSIAE
ncbi:bolA-like protein 3 isoform X1 [Anopheles arabiensis]|uniref:AGAP004778-PA n=3 Tax=gambiae species complex TaxID=44542 RepID=Q7Q2R4_ANOGA|nr:bolA-like protein 3 isoform X1 [Anopheles arabiensis]XP_040228868.1 bolA-like protein 3 isoform X1 [Anopheles coluzzii]XP_041768574.1 bolA-like protein 3 isoform X2 [Anopheles merus]XP_318038.3 bolA-like protein 3 isoform X1 [Anopheles gambiae]EAA13135.3 AGAP004778-PA [Anopheles gambiae str. PEST]